MKLLVIFVCVFVYANALSQSLKEEAKTEIEKLAVECFQKEKATDEDIEALINRNTPPTHAGKCVTFCISEKLGIIKADGTYGEGYVEWLDKAKADDPEFYEKLADLYEVCKEKVKDEEDVCEKTSQLADCAKTEGEKRGFNNYF